jgi:hypothetical protein
VISVVALALGGMLVSACSTSGEPVAGPAPSSSVTTAPASGRDAHCTPTAPNGQSPTGEAPSEQYLGNGGLYTVLWPDGVVVFEPGGPGELRKDGSLVMKWPFVRGEGASGQLIVVGRSLHRPGLHVSAEIPDGYGRTGFQATALIFPEPGCWEVTAHSGDATLTFVTRVESRY